MDVNKPHNNREVVIHSTEKECKDGRHVFQIDLDDCDIRDVVAEGYGARLICDNEIELEMPVYPFSRRVKAESDKIAEREKLNGSWCERTQDVVDVSRTAIVGQKKKLLLRFPEGTILSNDVH